MIIPIHYLPSGHIYLDPESNCDLIVDFMLETDYKEDFCVGKDFDEEFINRLMEAGFLVMSAAYFDDPPKDGDNETKNPFYILFPKLHLVRSALFFPELHVKKSIRRFLSHYELKVDTDFDLILDKCVQTHGADWLTPPLVKTLKGMRRGKFPAKPVSFALYREGELKAGEIGISMGRVYTSYSGYHEEDNAGTVQIILMIQWLEENGFSFLDFGMPLEYKTTLGATNLNPHHFVKLFREARY
jgi:Leu/Phe-tRNA-protein transferase